MQKKIFLMQQAFVFLVVPVIFTGCTAVEMPVIATAAPKIESNSIETEDYSVVIPVRQLVINQYPQWGISNVALSNSEIASRFQMVLFDRDQMQDYLPGYINAGFSGDAYIYLPARDTAGPEGLDGADAQKKLCTPEQQQLNVWSNSPTMDVGDFCEIHDAIIMGTALADYPDLYPTESWFLHTFDDSRIAYGYAGAGATYYIMNPGDAGWRTYFSRRALREVIPTDPSHPPVDGVTGIFIDNLNSTYYFIIRLTHGFTSREYPLKSDYDTALVGLVSIMHDTLSSYKKPLLGNLSSMDHPETWDLFFPYLDAVESETWVTHWEDGLPSATRIEQDLFLAEKTLTHGKTFLGIAQGNSNGDYNKFVLACYLLITDGQNAFYRYKNFDGLYREYYEIPEYFLRLGMPLETRNKISVNPIIYQRSFECGHVTANLSTGEAEIVATSCK